MKNFIKIEITASSVEAAEIMMADLCENNFYAFEQNGNILIAYIKEEDFIEAKLKLILPENILYNYSTIKNKNWNEEWEMAFHPVHVHDFAVIRASFHKPITDVEHEIIITPKMSFGTGHHATTYLMIEMMQSINFTNKKVIDFGTGTGVLAILAEKLGASSVVAIDYDEWSINNMLENIEANNCKKIFPEQKNTISGISSVDIVLANINFNVLQENAKNISLLLQAKSLLLISGFLVKDKNAMIEIFKTEAFIKKRFVQKDGWIALLLEKQ